jgi:hypothetical protein
MTYARHPCNSVAEGSGRSACPLGSTRSGGRRSGRIPARAYRRNFGRTNEAGEAAVDRHVVPDSCQVGVTALQLRLDLHGDPRWTAASEPIRPLEPVIAATVIGLSATGVTISFRPTLWRSTGSSGLCSAQRDIPVLFQRLEDESGRTARRSKRRSSDPARWLPSVSGSPDL